MRSEIVVSCVLAISLVGCASPDGVSVSGYTGTVHKTFRLTDADRQDHVGFETKFMADTAELIYNTATKYPDLTKIVVQEEVVGPSKSWKNDVPFEHLEEVRRMPDAATFRSYLRQSRERIHYAMLPDWVYMTDEEYREKKAKEVQIAKKEEERQEKLALEKEAERQRNEEATRKAEEEKQALEDSENERLAKLARQRQSGSTRTEFQNAEPAPTIPTSLSVPPTSETNSSELSELSRLAKERHQKDAE